MGTMLGFIALVAVSSHLAPYLPRRDIFFGVTVSRGFREGQLARKISRRYAIEVWLLAAAAAAIVATSPMPFVSGGMLLGLTIGASVAFAKAWSAVRPHAAVPTTIREAAIGPRDGFSGGIAGQLVSRIFASWNQLDGWLRKVDGVEACRLRPLVESGA